MASPVAGPSTTKTVGAVSGAGDKLEGAVRGMPCSGEVLFGDDDRRVELRRCNHSAV
nr:hypothetical protein [Rhodococcus wratislaviensis]GLK33645.1 hypothetical protein GCM10017611_04870 [Rhodococcus wratislaviensis]